MKTYYYLLLLTLLSPTGVKAQKSILKLTQPTLMHEVRETPSPMDGQRIAMNPPRFMWPDKFPHLGAVLDGVEAHDYKPHVTYRIRIARDRDFKQGLITAERNWAFFNPFQLFEKGTYYWQHAYVDTNGKEEWSPVYHFTVDSETRTFNPPALKEVLAKFPTTHPRILLDSREWNDIIARNRTNPEAQAYITKAKECISHPLKHLEEEIDTTQVVKLTNIVQRQSALIRESRKIVDREEGNIEGMVRAYLLTKDPVYYRGAMQRLSEILSWKNSPYFAGDFNLSTILSMSTSAYDAFYTVLTPAEKSLLLGSIRDNGDKFFEEYVNHLENRIADNHVWQMTYRILSMAAFAVYGELPEAATWVDYCYNVWVSRFPGLNADGGWHNGDHYFHVNIRTLIEVPVFYSRISGFDFFSDPWYNNNAQYVIYQQPPFSHAGGQGNSHEDKRTPSGARVGYADALARECNNSWAAAYVNYILERDPDILHGAFERKPGDLTWYRCITRKSPFPNGEVSTGGGKRVTLADMPLCKVFNETGIALTNTSLDEPKKNAMLSFRSSSYGSTSHALANQNAFNTFYGGKEIFYSSGHRTGFTDDHCMYSYRNTRAHNTILVNGMTQTIGTEGYGWIPRWYEGEKLSYFVGDASNAYGKVTSPLWLTRGELSGTKYTPEMGWDENKLNCFRRHVIQLGNTGVVVLYDELEGKEPVTWSYLLHTTSRPMEVNELPGKGKAGKLPEGVVVTGRNTADGISVAHLFCSEKMTHAVVDTFFCPPTNWKNETNAKGQTVKYPNHWHFSATTPKAGTARFLTIIDTHGSNRESLPVTHQGNIWQVGDWTIQCNLTPQGKAAISVTNKTEKTSLTYDAGKNEGVTQVIDQVKGKEVKKTLVDYLPDFEI